METGSIMPHSWFRLTPQAGQNGTIFSLIKHGLFANEIRVTFARG